MTHAEIVQTGREIPIIDCIALPECKAGESVYATYESSCTGKTVVEMIDDREHLAGCFYSQAIKNLRFFIAPTHSSRY